MRIGYLLSAVGRLRGALRFGPGAPPCAAPAADLARQRATAARVQIVRDDWGIAHVHGKSDADAVFGMVYAQAEDDFNRVEANYLTALGRTAEAEGEKAIWQDLRMRAVRRSRRPAGPLRQEPGLAEGADGRLGRRAELLPGHPSGRRSRRSSPASSRGWR